MAACGQGQLVMCAHLVKIVQTSNMPGLVSLQLLLMFAVFC